MILISRTAAGGPEAQLFVPRDARLAWLIFMTNVDSSMKKGKVVGSAKAEPFAICSTRAPALSRY